MRGCVCHASGDWVGQASCGWDGHGRGAGRTQSHAQGTSQQDDDANVPGRSHEALIAHNYGTADAERHRQHLRRWWQFDIQTTVTMKGKCQDRSQHGTPGSSSTHGNTSPATIHKPTYSDRGSSDSGTRAAGVKTVATTMALNLAMSCHNADLEPEEAFQADCHGDGGTKHGLEARGNAGEGRVGEVESNNIQELRWSEPGDKGHR